MTLIAPLALPEIQQGPEYHAQAVLDLTDLQLISRSGPGCGWVSGAEVGISLDSITHQLTYAVSVASGTVSIGGVGVSVSANPALACLPPNSTDRRDVVLVGVNGVPYFKPGTPCSVVNWSVSSALLPPLKPIPDLNTVVLAEVYIPGNHPPPDIPVNPGMIVDKRTPFATLQVGGAVQGLVHDGGGELFDVKNGLFGAVGDYVTGFTDGVMTNVFPTDPHTLASASAPFVAGDVGKTVIVQGAAASGAPLITTISAFVSTTTVTLTAPCTQPVSGASWAYGHDDSAAFDAAATAAGTAGVVVVPPSDGKYLIAQNRTWASTIFSFTGGVIAPAPTRTVTLGVVWAPAIKCFDFGGFGLLPYLGTGPTTGAPVVAINDVAESGKVEWFGAMGAGADDFLGLQNCILAANGGGWKINLLSKTYLTSRILRSTGVGQVIRGDSMETTTIEASAPMDAILWVDAHRHELLDFQLDGGGSDARTVLDGSTSSGSAVVTSVTANFTAHDVGSGVSGAGIPLLATIASVDSATQIHLSANATATSGGVSLTIGGDMQNAYAATAMISRRCQRGYSRRVRGLHCKNNGLTFDINYTNRTVTDGVTTNGSQIVTSATAAFTSADLNRAMKGTGIPSSAVIASVDSPTQVHLSVNATSTGSGRTLTIGTVGNNNFSHWTKCEGINNGLHGIGCPTKQSDNNDMVFDDCTGNNNGLGITVTGVPGHGILVKGNEIEVRKGSWTFNTGFGNQLGEASDTSSSRGCLFDAPYFEGNVLGGGYDAAGAETILLRNTGSGEQEFFGDGNSDSIHQIGANSAGVFVRRARATDTGLDFLIIPNPNTGIVTLQPGSFDGAITDAALLLQGLGTGGVKVGKSGGFVSFFGGTPLAQPANILNADGSLPDITTKFNTLLSYLRHSTGLSLIAG